MTDFCGVLSLKQTTTASELVSTMAGVWATRCHDRRTNHHEAGLALFHGARWTTPEACHETQPLIDRQTGLVYFGDIRIDNRQQLFRDLQLRGNSRAPITDIELVRSAHTAWGNDCFARLEGDYCLAIFNPHSSELLLARDHVGFKPVFYAQTRDYFAFASEAAALLALPGISGTPDRDSLLASLISDAIPADRTYFADISRVPAGCVLHNHNGKQRIQCYWSFADIEPGTRIGEQEAAEQLRHLLTEAVRTRSRCYGGLATELSGGLDSSTVTALVALQDDTHPTHCYSLRSSSAEWDEGVYIEALAKRYPLHLTPIWADQLDYGQRFSLRSIYSQGCDWPLDLMFAPHLALADRAREDGIRVILTGQGGDEMTQGSPRVIYDYWRSGEWRKLAGELAACEHKWWMLRYHLLSPMLPGGLRRSLRKALKLISGKYYSIPQPLTATTHNTSGGEDHSSNARIRSLLEKEEAALWRDANVYGLYGHRGIEVRHPFYDINVVRFCLQIDPGYHFNNGCFKQLLRKACAGVLPDSIRLRRDKAEFDSLVLRQLAAERKHTSINSLESNCLESLFPAEVWQGRNNLHAKSDWDHAAEMLEWKLRNLASWRQAGNDSLESPDHATTSSRQAPSRAP